MEEFGDALGSIWDLPRACWGPPGDAWTRLCLLLWLDSRKEALGASQGTFRRKPRARSFVSALKRCLGPGCGDVLKLGRDSFGSGALALCVAVKGSEMLSFQPGTSSLLKEPFVCSPATGKGLWGDVQRLFRTGISAPMRCLSHHQERKPLQVGF